MCSKRYDYSINTSVNTAIQKTEVVENASA
jgi:hypothetical protein